MKIVLGIAVFVLVAFFIISFAFLWSIEVIGEQQLIDRARELDKTPQPTLEQGELE